MKNPIYFFTILQLFICSNLIAQNIAYRFDYPIGDKGYNTSSNNSIIPILERITDGTTGERNNLFPNNPAINPSRFVSDPNQTNIPTSSWFNKQDVGSYYDAFGGLHPGEDWNKQGGDRGEAVYAVADGILHDIQIVGTLGALIVLKHTLPDRKNIYSLYLHITRKENTTGNLVSSITDFGYQIGVTQFNRGDIIARIGNISPSHLHFEIRSFYPEDKRAWRRDGDDGYYGGTDKSTCDVSNCNSGNVNPSNIDQVRNAFNNLKADEILDGSDFIDENRVTYGLNFGHPIYAGRATSPQVVRVFFKAPNDLNLGNNVTITDLKVGTNVIALFSAPRSHGNGYYSFNINLSNPATAWVVDGKYDIEFKANGNSRLMEFYGKQRVWFAPNLTTNDDASWNDGDIQNAINFGLFKADVAQNGSFRTYSFNDGQEISYEVAAKVVITAAMKVRNSAGDAHFRGDLSTLFPPISNTYETSFHYGYLRILESWGYTIPNGISYTTQITLAELAKMLVIVFNNVNENRSLLNNSERCTSSSNTYIQKLQNTFLTSNPNIGNILTGANDCSNITGSEYVTKSMLAKAVVRMYQESYFQFTSQQPTARITAGFSKPYSVIGDKFELDDLVSGTKPQSYLSFSNQSETMVAGQVKEFGFHNPNSSQRLSVGGSPAHFYWCVDGGRLDKLSTNPYFEKVKFTAPAVNSPTTVKLYLYVATKGGYVKEWFKDIVVNPSGTPPTTSGVSIQLSAGSLNFGSMAVNATADRTLTITNPVTSTGSLIGSITLPATSTGFSPMVGSTSFNLAPGQSSNLNLRFQPTSGGSFNAPVTIVHNAGNVNNPVSVSLLGVGTTVTQTPALNCTGAIPLTCEVNYTGTTAGGTNNVSQYGESGNYFPISASGPEKVHTFTATTTGTANFVFSETATGILDIFVLNTCGSTINTVANAGGGTNVRGSFNVVAGQTYYLVVDGENGANGSYSLKVECPAGSSGSGGGTSCATVNKTSIDFGMIGTGSYGGQNFTISNPTNQYAQGWVRFVGQHGSKFGVTVPGVGYLTEYQYSLNPNQSITLEVNINADIETNFQAQAKITFEGACTTAPFYINLKATNVPTLSWSTVFNNKIFLQSAPSQNEISWNSSVANLGSEVGIEFSTDGGLSWLPFEPGNRCTNNDEIDVFNNYSQNTKFGKMRIRTYCNDDYSPWVVSSGFFRIKDAPNNQVNMVFPDLQESLTCGQNITLQFQDTGYGGSLTIGYSTDNGTTKIPIATNIYQDGSWPKSYTYPWTVPNINSQTVKFYVSSIDGNYIDWSDANNVITCTVTPTVTITPTIIQPSCATVTNGSISLSASGATTYTYQWKKNGQTYGTNTSSLMNLETGLYDYTVTSNNGASANGSINLVVANPVAITETVTSAICTKANGSASLSITPTATYSYAWNTGETTSSISNKTSGNYTVTVTNTATGCAQTQTVNIPSITSPVNLSFNAPPTLCQNATTNLTVTPIGGASPYAYSWSEGSTTQTINKGNGSYWVSVTDANGCMGIGNVTVNQHPSIYSQYSVTNTLCSSSTGSIIVTPTGGVAPLTVDWGGGIMGTTRSNLAAGNYVYTVSDANGCFISQTVTIDTELSEPVTATLSGTQTINAGQSTNLSVALTGNAPWSIIVNGQTYSTITSTPFLISVSPANTTTYTLSSVSNSCGVGDVSGSVIITICTPPSAPSINSATINSGQTATLTASGCTGIVSWYNSAIGGSQLGTGITYITPVLTATTTYYANCTVNGCVSITRGIGVVTVNALPTNYEIAYYPFNGNANDESGVSPITNANSIVATLTPDRFGNPNKAYYFDNNGYISFSDQKMPAGNSPRTISLWFNSAIEQFKIHNGSPGSLLSYGVEGTNQNFNAVLWGNTLRVSNYSAPPDIDYAYTHPLNKWTHFTVTLDASNAVKIYIDGVLKMTSSVETWNTQRNGQMFVGKYFRQTKIDDIHIFSKALTAEEVAQLYQNEKPATTLPSKIAYYPFNGNANDESGVSPITNANSIVATLTPDRFGNPNKAYYFDNNGYISFSDQKMPAGNSQRTISLWFNSAIEQFKIHNGSPGSLLSYGVEGTNKNFNAVLWGNTLRVSNYSAPPDIDYAYTHPLNKWTHFTVTLDASNAVKIYIDGVLKMTSSVETWNTQRNGQMFVGKYFRQTKIDDINIFSTALTNEEVAQLYQNEKPATSTRIANDNMKEEKVEKMSLEISPNPPVDNLTKIITRLPSAASLKLSLVNVLGNIIGTWEFNEAKAIHETEMNIQGLTIGIYTIIAESNGEVRTGKLIKVH